MANNVPVAGMVLKDDQGRYLLVQEKQPKAYGLWNLPAGWVDEGETPQQTAVREAEEEVGFEVKILDDKPLCSMLNNAKDRMLHSFRAEIAGGKLEFQEEELLDAGWFSLGEIEELDFQGKIRARWVIESIRKAEKEK